MINRVIQARRHFDRKCQHTKFIVDEAENFIECGICGEKLNPIWVVMQMASSEHRAIRNLEEIEEIMKKALAKTKCKCQHCNKMTDIVR
jgi:ribosomal protein S27E